MPTQLSLYNAALRLLGERKLASLSENREPRRLLDAVWDNGATEGAVKHCLQLGQWTFAMRTAMVDYSPSVEPSFGYRRAFDQPADMVKLSAICSDEYFKQPLLEYADERQYWYADLDTIYVRYVSNGADYGADLSLWPESFTKVVEAYLAAEICENLTQSETKLQSVEKKFSTALKSARSLDAMNKPTAFMPVGSWAGSRSGRFSHRRSLWSGN
ncbi:hypothetical protein BSL82_09525 [Tardibacter chloracetimidivorans]|uniref:Uncharacterized protein n=1 Tax=Tardibacter chloracetimidivorans TaxID=1921510 RepID=A0A1L3ZV95_9SPHN|nr:hypothetical protein [Tardibacter chloracetimidivorans]API59520.1 hypothetical protein BSL82_09525 [Tardibacter chloracetimidivorans]